MPRKRNYTVKGTNDFLVLALIFFFLGIWAVKDGWYPSEKVQKKHPRELKVSASEAGVVKEIKVEVGETVIENQSVATIHKENEDGSIESIELKAPKKGEIIKVLVNPKEVHENGKVEAGNPVMIIRPDDHFYLFNKSLTVVSSILFVVFMCIHLFGR